MFEKKHFAKCRFSPFDNLLKTELQEISDDERFLKYMVCVYDPASPFVKKFPEVKKRKDAAASFAGYDLNNKEDMEIFSQISVFLKPAAIDEEKEEEENKYLAGIFTFLTKYAFPKEWFMICCNEQMFVEYGLRMLKPVAASNTNIEKDFIDALSNKEKLALAQESASNRIDALYLKMFGEEVDVSTVDKRQGTRPEDYA